MNIGHSAGFFRLSSGIRQGDPILAYLFILVIETLFIQVCNNENIGGLKTFCHEFKITSFADDVSYSVQDIDSAEELLRLFIGYS